MKKILCCVALFFCASWGVARGVIKKEYDKETIEDTKDIEKLFNAIKTSNYSVVLDLNYLFQGINAKEIHFSNGFTPLHASIETSLETIAMAAYYNEEPVKSGCQLTSEQRKEQIKKYSDVIENDKKIRELLLSDVFVHREFKINKQESPFYDFTPLHFAAYYGYTDFCSALIDKSANINEKISDKNARYAGYTPLLIAVDERKLETVKLLLAKHAEINEKISDNNSDYPSFTALHIASSRREGIDIVKELLKNKPAIDTSISYEKIRYFDFSPLAIAVFWGNADICKELIKNDANVELEINNETKENKNRDFNGYTPLHIAVERSNSDQNKNYTEIVGYLLNKNKDLINKKIEAKLTIFLGYTPLHLALYNKKIDMCKTLLNFGADINQKIDSGPLCGLKAIHLVAAFGNKEIFDLLVEKGADINEKITVEEEATNSRYNGFAPIHLAIEHNNLEVFAKLLEKGVDPNTLTAPETPTYSCFAPIHLAAYHGKIKILEKLLATGKVKINTTIQNNNRYCHSFTPLLLAVYESHINTVNFLLDQKDIDINVTINDKANFRNGFTALHCAAFDGVTEIFTALIKKGADATITVSKENEKYAGLTPFGLAKKLNEEGVRVYYQEEKGRKTILALEPGKIQITPTTEKQSEKEKIEIRKKEEEIIKLEKESLKKLEEAKKKIDPLAESLSLLKAKLLHLAMALKGNTK